MQTRLNCGRNKTYDNIQSPSLSWENVAPTLVVQCPPSVATVLEACQLVLGQPTCGFRTSPLLYVGQLSSTAWQFGLGLGRAHHVVLGSSASSRADHAAAAAAAAAVVVITQFTELLQNSEKKVHFLILVPAHPDCHG